MKMELNLIRLIAETKKPSVFRGMDYTII